MRFATWSSSTAPAPPSARGAKGKLVATRLDEAGANVLRALLDRNPKVKDTMIEDVGLGNVGGLRRVHAARHRRSGWPGLPLEACSFNSNRQCGSSMETLHRVAMSIQVGATDCGVALGIERMGRGLGGGRQRPRRPASRSSTRGSSR